MHYYLKYCKLKWAKFGSFLQIVTLNCSKKEATKSSRQEIWSEVLCCT